MFELGLIGYGSMGSMLLNNFLMAGVLRPEHVIVSTRTKDKLTPLLAGWPGVTVAKGNRALAMNSKMVLIAVKPSDFKPLLDEIIPYIHNDAHLISIAGGVTVRDLESLFPGKVTRLIPSIMAEVGQGIALACHNNRVTADDVRRIDRMFGAIGTMKIVRESDLDTVVDLTSTAPGLIVAMLQEYAKAGVRHSTLTDEEAEQMLIATLYGTAKLLSERGMSLDDVISRVATKGGSTEEGVKVLRNELPLTFDNMLNSTTRKRKNAGLKGSASVKTY